MKKIIWPENKDFAFTIIDDTDEGTIENTKPIYDFLFNLGIRTTKTVWVFPSMDRFSGGSLAEPNYLEYIKKLKQNGFEIALHGVGSGGYDRLQIIKGIDLYKKLLGNYPHMHINHAQNPSNMYFGVRGGSKFLQLYSKYKAPFDKFYGHDENSKYFWGDICKRHIKYIRGRVFRDINTLKKDPLLPFIDKDKEKYSNYWFSSSDGVNVARFNSLIDKKNVDRLAKENGLCIVYTHFAYGFVDKDGVINEEFKKKIKYLVSKNGWFVPAGEILDYVLQKKNNFNANQFYQTFLDFKKIIEDKLYGR